MRSLLVVSIIQVMARRLTGLCVLLVVNSLPAQDSVALRFGGWEVPATATVTERWVLRGGVLGEVAEVDDSMVFRYRVELTALGDDLRLDFHEFETQELNGVDVTGPDMSGWRVTAAHFAMEYPPVRISRDGYFLGVVEFSSWLERSLEHLESETPEWSDIDPAEYRQPTARAYIENRAMKRWYTWVAMWTKFEFVRGRVTETTEPVAIGDVTVDAQIRLEQLEQRDDGRVALRIVSRLGGEKMIEALCRVKAEQNGTPVPPEGPVPRCADETSGTDTFEVVTDPATLRPSTASYESRGGGRLGDQRYESFESRHYTFDWD